MSRNGASPGEAVPCDIPEYVLLALRYKSLNVHTMNLRLFYIYKGMKVSPEDILKYEHSLLLTLSVFMHRTRLKMAFQFHTM